MLPYFQDLYDHLVRVLDKIDLDREMLAAALDANLSVTSNNLNVIVKRLTAFTVILMIPTLIAGIYGMNFRLMPELLWPFGYRLCPGADGGQHDRRVRLLQAGTTGSDRLRPPRFILDLESLDIKIVSADNIGSDDEPSAGARASSRPVRTGRHAHDPAGSARPGSDRR